MTDLIKNEKTQQTIKFLEALLKASVDGILLTDVNQNIILVNNAFCKIVGFRKEEMIETSLFVWLEHFDGDALNYWAELEQDVQQDGSIKDVEFKKTNQGDIFYVSVNASLIEQVANEERGFILSIWRDITQSKKAEQKIKESEKKFRTIFEAIPDLYFLVSSDNTILEWRGKEEDLYLQPEDFLGKKIYEKFPENLSQLFNASISITLRTKNPQTIEYKLLLGDNYRSFEARHFYFSNDKVAVFIRDITERKNFEQKLRESEENYREAYNRADFYKNIVIHDMSNILQNLIASVELFSLFSEKTEDIKKLRDQNILIKSSVERGMKLISNVRKLSRLEEVGISIKSIEIIKVLEESVSYLRKSFPDKEIIVKIDAPSKALYVNANELLLDVFENILNNASKYNENSIVLIFVNIYKEIRQNVGYIRLDFKDNGIGITDDKKNSIFQKGFKKEKKTKGMGIGLSLVSKIIEGYNGKIWVEDKVKGDYTKGSNFIVLIPEFIE